MNADVIKIVNVVENVECPLHLMSLFGHFLPPFSVLFLEILHLGS